VTKVPEKLLSLALVAMTKANYLVCGFNTGFRIGFQGDRHFRASSNLKSACEFPEIVRFIRGIREIVNETILAYLFFRYNPDG
jgi:hypothetical protein